MQATSKNSTFRNDRKTFLKLLRALRFFLKSFYFFFNRVARYTQSKESRNLPKKIPQITYKAIFRNCLLLKSPLPTKDIFRLLPFVVRRLREKAYSPKNIFRLSAFDDERMVQNLWQKNFCLSFFDIRRKKISPISQIKAPLLFLRWMPYCVECYPST